MDSILHRPQTISQMKRTPSDFVFVRIISFLLALFLLLSSFFFFLYNINQINQINQESINYYVTATLLLNFVTLYMRNIMYVSLDIASFHIHIFLICKTGIFDFEFLFALLLDTSSCSGMFLLLGSRPRLATALSAVSCVVL